VNQDRGDQADQGSARHGHGQELLGTAVDHEPSRVTSTPSCRVPQPVRRHVKVP
jgi:hypothetical protein